ncbi:ImmA/IrrE family metallo-endopeptidase [Methylorubrum suomiense]|uniref:IrrE N-terminal-like domain-containing protein n=1 Tax=Methylorubrum suomiense TaxID=144191 RepID=A0ABQ4UZ58_9HYPH|nr:MULTISPECIES: ImmA/IrrE family metallo-endopeptidase [Methylobacteriaceae]GJE77398.1 hypothetical protein BGCPKDLD_4002 [Methylorubrum suomiense]
MTNSQFSDRYVEFVSEQRIKEHAHSWRSAHGNPLSWKINVVDFLLNTFQKRFKKHFEIKLFKRSDSKDAPAYVRFDPIELWIDENIWALAKAGSGYSAFVIAHEIGHLIFHSALPKGFSSDRSHQISYTEDGHSAEWQANTFAGHFLLPSLLVEQFDNPEQIIECCSTWEEIAQSRFAEVHDKRNDLASVWASQQTCANCGNLGLVRAGTLSRCKICKSSYSD